MVFQKKGAAKKEQAKVSKKVFKEEDDDSDLFDDMDDLEDDMSDSEEEMTVQKTPQNKTPKGRQSLSEKKVSFQMPGKNTPAKTPNKSNSVLSKKQPTPGNKGKTAVQEFKGMKGKKNQSKQDDDDEEEEDDDSEEEDSDEEVDDEDDDLDLELDDDEGEDDDDDDSEEGEEGAAKKSVQNKLSLLRQKNNIEQKQKTPKAADKSKSALTPKGQSPKEAQKNDLNKIVNEDETVRRNERNAKMLYLGNLPNDVTQTELKTLSPDVLDCVIPLSNRSHASKSTYAFLVFASEKKAEVNFKIFQEKKLRGQPLTVDFVGEKSKNKKPDSAEKPKHYNLKKLLVAGLPVDATLEMVAKFFPKAFMISFNMSHEFRSATLLFNTEEAASEAFKANRDIEIGGQKVTVLHALVGKNANKKGKRPMGVNKKFGNGNRSQGGQKRNFGSGKNINDGENPAKRMRKMKNEDN